MKHPLVASILLLLCFCACKKESEPEHDTDTSFHPEYFEFGYGGGFAGVHKSFVIKDGKLFPSDTAQPALSASQYNTARILIDHFPAYLLAHPNQNYDCDLCADTFVIGIRVRINGATYVWEIDPAGNQVPIAIQPYAKEVFKITDQL